MTRLAAFATLVLVLALLAAPALADTAVCKFVGAKEGTPWGHHALVITVAPVSGGTVELVVPNKDPMNPKFDPVDAIATLVKAAKAGDIMEATWADFKGKNMLSALKNYDLKPGEDEPNVYVFAKSSTVKNGKDEIPAVEVTKLGKDSTFTVPMPKGADGKPAADPDITKVIAGLKKGDSVEIIPAPGGGNTPAIKTIKAYEPPKKGEFVELGKQTVGQTEYQTVELKDSTTKILIPPADATNLLAKLKPIKAGTTISCKVRTDDKGTWLVDVKLAPADKPKDK